uniref:Uncharacterized protein n=1 Tax=Arundo donax TaxID=35708 RepID=A0A0A9DDV0_ARUDO
MSRVEREAAEAGEQRQATAKEESEENWSREWELEKLEEYSPLLPLVMLEARCCSSPLLLQCRSPKATAAARRSSSPVANSPQAAAARLLLLAGLEEGNRTSETDRGGGGGRGATGERQGVRSA